MDGKTVPLVTASLAMCALGAYSILEVDAASINARASIGANSVNVYWNDINDPTVDAYFIDSGKTGWQMPPHVTSIQDTRDHSPGDRISYEVCAADKDIRDPSSNAWHRVACDSVSVTIPNNAVEPVTTPEPKYPTSNRAPNAVIDAPSSIFEDRLVSISGKRSSDPNHDTLTYDWEVDHNGVGYIWDGRNSNFYAPQLTGGDATILLTLTVSDGTLSDSATKSILIRDNTPPKIKSIQYVVMGSTLTAWAIIDDAENNVNYYKWYSNCGIGQQSLFSGNVESKMLMVDVSGKSGNICLTLEVRDYQHSDRLWTNVHVS